MCSPLSFHFFYVTLKAEEILYLSKKKSEMENRSLVTIADHSKEKIMYLLRMAGEFEKHTNRKLLEGKVVATLFFEPSTRTRLSFETAANRLGARVIGFTDPKVTSSTKGETLKDTIMMVSNYADLIVMRHYKTQGTLDNLQIYMVGDLKYGRTVHSLLMAMRHFNPTFHFIAPEELKMPDVYKQYCDIHHIKYVEHTDFTADTIAGADILYMTRVQKERFTDLMEYERVKDLYLLKLSMLKKAKDNMRILHPLPRVNEIEYAIDDDPHAYYFEQAHNGLFARQALICDALGLTLDDVINDRTIID